MLDKLALFSLFCDIMTLVVYFSNLRIYYLVHFYKQNWLQYGRSVASHENKSADLVKLNASLSVECFDNCGVVHNSIFLKIYLQIITLLDLQTAVTLFLIHTN